jgi:GT2 family glycosyltransferase
MYFEDSDFCLRTRTADFKIRIDPRTLVCHKLNPKMGKEKISKIKNLLNANAWFIKKYIGWYFWPLAYVYLGLLGLKMLFTP